VIVILNFKYLKIIFKPIQFIISEKINPLKLIKIKNSHYTKFVCYIIVAQSIICIIKGNLVIKAINNKLLNPKHPPIIKNSNLLKYDYKQQKAI
jgi:hypothetical protein